jgi:hypothetical protein
VKRREAVVGEAVHEPGVGVEQLPQPVDPPERGRVEDVEIDPVRGGLGSGTVAAVQRLAHGRRLRPVPAELVGLRAILRQELLEPPRPRVVGEGVDPAQGIEVRVPAGAVAGARGTPQLPVVEHEERAELLRLELEAHDRVVLAGEPPFVLEHARLLPREDPARRALVAAPVAEDELDQPAGLAVEARGVGKPAPELLRIGERRPELLGGEVVETPEADGAALAVAPERAVLGLNLGHAVSFRARRSSVSSASSRCAQNER